MIRFVVGLFIFAVVLCAYIVSRPGTPRVSLTQAPFQQADVSRSDAGNVLPLPENSASLAAAANAAAQQASPRDDLGFATTPATVNTAVQDVLVQLGVTDPAAPVPAEVSAALQGISTITGEGDPTSGPLPFALFVGRQLQNGQGDVALASDVLTAAKAGEIAVPASLVTAGGQIDLPTFLRAIVGAVEVATGASAPAIPDVSNDPGAIISAAGYDYIVTPQDSLAGIALKFYGDAQHTTRILVANQPALPRADRLVPGQALIIPTL